MKRFSMVFFLLVLMVATASSDVGDPGETGSSYTLSLEDHTQGYPYPAGFYYEYTLSAPGDNVDPLGMLHLLEEHRITVKEGWHRPYLTGCSPPGSNRTTKAIYSNVFIVRLDAPNDDMPTCHFRALELPKPISCGYQVRHYRLDR